MVFSGLKAREGQIEGGRQREIRDLTRPKINWISKLLGAGYNKEGREGGGKPKPDQKIYQT